MISWPALGTRVTVRYRRPAGSSPSLTDAVGHLLATEPVVRVRTKTGAVVEIDSADVVALRALTDAPVRSGQIRALEHAAAFAWPGVERQWLDGWLLRAGHGVTFRANSAVPLDISANQSVIPAIVDWYLRRDLTPRLAVADRLLRLPGTGERPNRVFVRNVSAGEPHPSVTLACRPDAAWLGLSRHAIPVDVLTAVVDGELAFAVCAGIAVGRAAVTNAPDGTRWVGLSLVTVADGPGGCAHVKRLCEALLAWGANRGATRGYVRVADDNTAANSLIDSLGFTLHHHSRYFSVAS
ncbi:GNAT family N-acetyltransferase [Mycobacterium sp. SM1]|uniref:N-acetylglutamate synthase, CG3035 family n=1 Tax=Mycobacterium sp. SM1 TaxID=2816243 RepID=UPI001BCEB9C9|nr:GNAT family N-acetyltransferase [Mycobacterium sp. SM1]MBS4728468.1 GNAT family N-acetyltransferase [Mycobacterium sp. SM1]